MKEKSSVASLLLILLAFFLSSCTVVERISPDPTAAVETTAAVFPTATAAPLNEPRLGLAAVESLEILKQESFPVEIDIRITGVLANACTAIDNVVVERDGNRFNAVLTTVQEPGSDCSEKEVPFEEILPLNVLGLEAGSYTASVNGIQGSFNLDVNNELHEDPVEDAPVQEAATATVEPTAVPAAETFSVDGRVWHDVCVNGSSDGNEVPAGCTVGEDGTLAADGLLENEPGIEGVHVNLGEEPCPSAAVIVTATTNAEGVFSFGNLKAGEYCIFVDSDDVQNQEILLPGSWTAPTGDVAEAAVIVGDEAAEQVVNFGWDYELLPVDLAACDNSFEFVEDLNIEDDTIFAPGEEFIKRWRLRNSGTCPWNREYAVVFVGGDQMGAEARIPLAESVAVSQTLDVEVPMVAPDEAGSYRGNWQIADPSGDPFGIDGNIEDAFWLRVVVDEESVPSATPLPNSGAIGGAVWDDYCINSSPGRGCVESGEGSGVFIADGAFDALEVGLSEISISLAEDACPADGTLPNPAVVETAVTDADGRYLFEGLSDSTYCIFMDALSAENVDSLIPGNWTWPGTGVGQYTFILDPGEQALDLDFGWDYVD